MNKIIACSDCGQERLVRMRNGKPVHTRCCKCSNKAKAMVGEANPNWCGGKIERDGYVMVRVYKDDPLYCMVQSDNFPYVMEHRLVMARHLGRPLTVDEKIHHENEIRDDNSYTNFEITENRGHAIIHDLGHHPEANRTPPNNAGKTYRRRK